MTFARLLILFATREGQTAKIADRIGDVARVRGYQVEVRDLRYLPSALSLEAFDGVVLGAPVHYAKHPPELVAFVKAHVEELRRVPSAFFSVSMVAASTSPEERQEARDYVERLQSATDWRPRLIGLFPGALRYSDYGLVVRWVMRRIARRRGRATDTSRDWEYTSWESVDRFAETFLETLPAARGEERRVIDEGPGPRPAAPP